MSSSQPSLLDQRSPDQIRSRPCPDCYVCGGRGTLLYEDLNDRLFGAPGVWNVKRCPNPACGLLWLDPMPDEEDIGKAYAEYYTHFRVSQHQNNSGLLGRLTWILRLIHDLLLRATLISGERKRLGLMYLDRV